MKRLLSCLLLAAMLLSLCGCDILGILQPTDKPGMVNDVSDSTEPSAADAESPAPETTAAALAATNELGIYTDYSQYAPAAGLPAANYTRLSADPIPELKPGNYGKILPFAAEPTYSSDEGGYSYRYGNYYGFITEDGKIVCDPVYLSAYRLSFYDSETQSTGRLPFWIFTRMGEVHEESYDGNTWMTGESVCGLVAEDGSFVLPCDYSYIEGYPNGFITHPSWEYSEFEVYDLQGKRVFGSSELAKYIVFGEYSSVSYSDGVFVIWTNEKNYVVDETGKLLFGPMNTIGTFSKGIAPASEDGMSFGYVDTSGNWVIRPTLDSAEQFHGDYAVAATGRGPCVIDRSGNVLFTIDEGGYLSWCGEDYFCFSPNEGNEQVYNSKGEQLLQAGENEYWTHLFGDIFCANYYGEDAQRVVLCNVSTGKSVTVPNGNYVLNFYSEGSEYSEHLMYQGEPCIVVHCWEEGVEGYEYGRESSVVVNYELEIVQTQDDLSFTTDFDQITGEYYTVCSTNGYRRKEYYRSDGSLLGVFNESDAVSIYDGRLQVTDLYSAKLYDKTGKEVFCYPLLAALED